MTAITTPRRIFRMKDWRLWRIMVGRDTPKSIRPGRACKTSLGQAVVIEQKIPYLQVWGVAKGVRSMSNLSSEQFAQARRSKQSIFSRYEEDLLAMTVLHLTWNCGLGMQECSELRWENVESYTLQVNGRSIPLPEDSAKFLRNLEHTGPFVVFTDRSSGRQVNRASLSRKLRGILDHVGLSSFKPSDLQEMAVVDLAQAHGVNAAVKAFDLWPRTVLTFARQQAVELSLAAGPVRSWALDHDKLKHALEQEGDTPVARVIWLSWQGKLLLRQIRSLRWADICLPDGIWNIDYKSQPIPEGIRNHLECWQVDRSDYVLETSGGMPLEITWMSRIARAFFPRYGLEGLSMDAIRGRVLTDKVYFEEILRLTKGIYPTETAALKQKLGLSPWLITQFLKEMKTCNLLVQPTVGGHTKDENRKRFVVYLQSHRGETLTAGQIGDGLNVTQPLAQYYIKQFLKEGCLNKVRRGRYLVDSEFSETQPEENEV